MEKRKKIHVGLFSSVALELGLLSVLFVFGGLIGMTCAGCIDGESGVALGEYLNACLSQTNGLQFSAWSVFWKQLRFPLAVCLLSVTTFGVIGIPVVFGVRGFLFTFSVACFSRFFGWMGLLPALALFGVPALIWMPVLFWLGTQGMGRSMQLLRQEITPMNGTLWKSWCVCVVILWGGVLLEMFVVPRLFTAAAQMVL